MIYVIIGIVVVALVAVVSVVWEYWLCDSKPTYYNWPKNWRKF